MPAGHPVDTVGHSQHPPPPVPSPIKGTNSLCRHRQLLPLCTQAVIRYWVIGVNGDISDLGVFHCDNGLGGLNMT